MSISTATTGVAGRAVYVLIPVEGSVGAFLATRCRTTYSCPMVDDNIPATKKDLRDLGQAVKKDLTDLEQRVDQKLEQMEARLVQHFNVVAENLVADFKGIFKDRLEQHEDRITRLERKAGLIAA